ALDAFPGLVTLCVLLHQFTCLAANFHHQCVIARELQRLRQSCCVTRLPQSPRLLRNDKELTGVTLPAHPTPASAVRLSARPESSHRRPSRCKCRPTPPPLTRTTAGQAR